jgi:hypothetical protein
MKAIKLSLALLGASVCNTAFSHGDFTQADAVRLNASVVAGYSHLDRDLAELWQVPGVLMGGDAHGSEAGFALNEAALALYAGSEEGSFGELEAGTHGHGDASALELEQAFVGSVLKAGQHTFKLEAGRMTALFSPEYGRHASESLFTRKPLAYDLFWGGHGNDTGARTTWQFKPDTHHQFQAGLELYRGDQFPATAGNSANAGAVFTRWQWQGPEHRVSFGLWHYTAKAHERNDDRLDSGHNHGTATSTDDSILFSGDTASTGLHAQWQWHFAPQKQFGLAGEVMQFDSDGDVRDATRLATLRSQHAGFWLQGALMCAEHQFAVRYERIALDNHLSGSGASVLVESAHLATGDHAPGALSAAWQWQFKPELALRLEQRLDLSTEDTRSETMLNLVWMRAWLF